MFEPELSDEEQTRRGVPAGKVLLSGLMGLVLAILLNAGALLRDAEEKPFGSARNVSVAVWEPVEGISSALGITKPREWADSALGRDTDDKISDLSDDSDSGGTATTTSLGEGGSRSVVPPPTTVWAPTEVDPLQLWVAGDSMVQFFGDVLVGIAQDTGVIEATAESKLSSGLTRPDFFNWPARLSEVISEEDPHAVVLMFGGNDAQGIVTSDGVAQPFSDEWVAEYSTRVGAVMDLAAGDENREVIWVGQPIMNSADFDFKMQQLNEIYETEAASRPRVTFVATRTLFADESGGYSRYLLDDDGGRVDARLTDGIHLSTEGGRRLSEVLVATLGSLIPLEPDDAAQPQSSPALVGFG